VIAADLVEMAEDELKRAVTLSWRELSKVTPWGDSYDGFSPTGRAVTIERNYLWADAEGGDILCEIVVYGGDSRYDQGARTSAVIEKKETRK
jgi:hypothetical protein